MPHSELIHRYFDEGLDGSLEDVLFEQLARDSELRREFAEHARMHAVIRRDVAAVTPPAALTDALFTSLGLVTGAASEDHTAAPATAEVRAAQTVVAETAAARASAAQPSTVVPAASAARRRMHTAATAFLAPLRTAAHALRAHRGTIGTGVLSSLVTAVLLLALLPRVPAVLPSHPDTQATPALVSSQDDAAARPGATAPAGVSASTGEAAASAPRAARPEAADRRTLGSSARNGIGSPHEPTPAEHRGTSVSTEIAAVTVPSETTATAAGSVPFASAATAAAAEHDASTAPTEIIGHGAGTVPPAGAERGAITESAGAPTPFMIAAQQLVVTPQHLRNVLHRDLGDGVFMRARTTPVEPVASRMARTSEPVAEGGSASQHSVVLEMRMMNSVSYPAVELPYNANEMFKDLAVSAIYTLSARHALGVEYGRETFGEIYTSLEKRTVSATMHGIFNTQQPWNPATFYENRMLDWVGVVWKVSIPELTMFRVIEPYARTLVGGTGQGPVGKLRLGLEYHPTSFSMVSIGAEGTALRYRIEGTWYQTNKLGATLGLAVGF